MKIAFCKMRVTVCVKGAYGIGKTKGEQSMFNEKPMPFYMSGSMSLEKERDEAMERGVENPEILVFRGNPAGAGSGGTGLR